MIFTLARQKLFQSTLPRGERPLLLSVAITVLPFQSTLPRGERPSESPFIVIQVGISIHAPARGATTQESLRKLYHQKFQSTLPRGERQLFSVFYHTICKFQSTLPRGERLVDSNAKSNVGNFNPRSREGSDRGWRERRGE